MPVPSAITELSTTPASNSPAGSESPSTTDDYLRSQAAFIAQLRAVIGGAADANIPSAWLTAAAKRSLNGGATTLSTATTLTSSAAGKLYSVSANVTITLPSANAVSVGSVIAIRATSANGCTVNATLGDVGGAASMVMRSGELVEFMSNTVAGGGWLVVTRQAYDAFPLSAKDNPAMGSFIGTQTKMQTVASGATNPVYPVNGCYIKNTATAPSTWAFNTAFIDTSVAIATWRVEITNGGAFTQTWPGSVVWDNGSAPVLQASGVDTIEFWHDGTTLRGRHISQGTVGNGQTWQNVSRALGTTYTNSTGRPIMVSASANMTIANQTLQFFVNGAVQASVQQDGYAVGFQVIVPSGATYSMGPAVNFTLVHWSELR